MIKGFIGTSLVDYPGKIASVVFFGGCNYRCPFCQNSWLVSEQKLIQLPTLEVSAVAEMTVLRSKFIDGVVLSGGEPTLYPSLIRQFISTIKSLSPGKLWKVKLDTNGSHPEILVELINQNLIDYVALDLKTSPTKYDQLTGCPNSFEKVGESIRILSQAPIDSELRTTFVPGLTDKPELIEMIPFIREAKKYALQPFRPQDTLDETYSSITPYSGEVLHELAEWVRQQTSIEVVER